MLVTSISSAAALTPSERLADLELEARAQALELEFRCLVCRNQSIADSDAGLARDLRRFVRERLSRGDDERVIREKLVARYGTYILLEPPLVGSTILLWGAPLILLGLGGMLAFFWVRRQRKWRLQKS